MYVIRFNKHAKVKGINKEENVGLPTSTSFKATINHSNFSLIKKIDYMIDFLRLH